MQSKGTDDQILPSGICFQMLSRERMQADRQNASDVWTLSHLFSLAKKCDMIWI